MSVAIRLAAPTPSSTTSTSNAAIVYGRFSNHAIIQRLLRSIAPSACVFLALSLNEISRRLSGRSVRAASPSTNCVADDPVDAAFAIGANLLARDKCGNRHDFLLL